MPTTEHLASDTARCFLLTDMRITEVLPRSVVIDSVSGRGLMAIMTQPPQPGSLVQFNLGDLGWVDAVVRWTGGRQVGVELQREIETGALLGQETRRLPGSTERRMA